MSFISINIDTERIITEVRLRPPLWDSSDDLYKDRDARLKAWFEVCEATVPNYDDFSESEKKEIERHIQQRWKTARDAYTRCRNTMKKVKSGSRDKQRIKYAFFDQLKFLHEQHAEDTADSIEENHTNNSPLRNTKFMPPTNPSDSSITGTITFTTNTLIGKRRKIIKSNEDRDIDRDVLQFLRDNSKLMQNDDMAFFYSLLPIVQAFDNRQKMLFRSEVMKKAMEISDYPTSAANFASPVYASESHARSSASSMDIKSAESESEEVILIKEEVSCFQDELSPTK